MRRTLFLFAAVLACAKSENKPDTTAAAAAKVVPAPAPALLSLTDLAGKWNVVGKTETGDSTLATYVMTATPDTTGWTIAFPNRPVMPARVSVTGDSVAVDFGPYESVLRKSVQVTAHTIYHMNAGKLTGTTVAHYTVKTADSVRNIRSEASRAP